jgi:polar amino acid transport system ATP-binding protein
VLIADNISKQFGPVQALHGVSLTLQPGRITVVLGPSGSGKTTLLRCLSLLAPPDTGRFQLDAYDYTFPSTIPVIVPSAMGVVFQNLALWPHLTLRENILLPLRLRNLMSHEPYVALLIKTLSMERFIDRLPREVSGGERQRAALLRALALRPAYLLLDEITSALDVEQVSAVLHELERLKADGVGVMLITHLLRFARRTADQFLFIDQGRVIETGPITQLDQPQSERLRSFLHHVSDAS